MRTIATLLASFALALGAPAQTTFTVTVATKTSEHPFFGQGNPEGYVVDGREGATLTLMRGQTYTFRMQGVPSAHPFYLSTSASGAGAGVWGGGVVGNFATGNAELTFTVPASAPDELWYQCTSHARMGGRIAVVSASDVEGEGTRPALDVVSANPARGVVRVRLATAGTPEAQLAVFAVDGRRVAVLHEGPLAGAAAFVFDLDTAALAPGVYLVRAAVGAWTAERRVTVVR